MPSRNTHGAVPGRALDASLHGSRHDHQPLYDLSNVTSCPITDEPFPRVLRALMHAKGLSFRALAAETARHDPSGRGITHGHLGQLAGAHQHPSQRAVELLAAALDVAPEYFLEYRLAQLRHALNEREVGYDRARDTLRRFAA